MMISRKQPLTLQPMTMIYFSFFLLCTVARLPSRPSDSIFSSSFWLSSRTQTDWTELDVYEIGGGVPGGPGPGFPYLVFSNAHVFRRTGTAITPETVVSSPANYVAKERLSSSWHTYALQWYDGRWISNVLLGLFGLLLALNFRGERSVSTGA